MKVVHTGTEACRMRGMQEAIYGGVQVVVHRGGPDMQGGVYDSSIGAGCGAQRRAGYAGGGYMIAVLLYRSRLWCTEEGRIWGIEEGRIWGIEEGRM